MSLSQGLCYLSMAVLQLPKLVRNAEISEKGSLTAGRVAWQRYFIWQNRSEQEAEAARAGGDHHHPSSSWRDGVTVWGGLGSSQGAKEVSGRGEGGKQVCGVNENGAAGRQEVDVSLQIEAPTVDAGGRVGGICSGGICYFR